MVPQAPAGNPATSTIVLQSSDSGNGDSTEVTAYRRRCGRREPVYAPARPRPVRTQAVHSRAHHLGAPAQHHPAPPGITFSNTPGSTPGTTPRTTVPLHPSTTSRRTHGQKETTRGQQ
ncbi:hypothetical protein GCM10027091_29570 [Streptomyces daliensis]